VLSAALTLPPEERERLAERLLKSVGNDDGNLSPAWTAEIGRRLKEIDEGTAELVDGEEFVKWLRSKSKPAKDPA
jgi:putative addiction module component (TIGR02574 family)